MNLADITPYRLQANDGAQEKRPRAARKTKITGTN